MAKNAIISDFTTGSIPKQLTRFMLPFMASNALQVAYSLVDMVIVGKFVGSSGLSGVSQGGVLINFLIVLGFGLCNSGQIIISQLIGADRKEELRSVIGTMFTVFVSLGAVVAAVLLLFREQFITLLAVPPEAREMAIQYVGICSVGVFFSYGYNVICAALRGMGDSRRPFLFITASSFTNLILDYLFTGLLGFGVAGAAAATSISHFVSFTCALVFMVRHKKDFYFDFRPASFKVSPVYIGTLIRLGIPIAIQTAAVNLSMMVVNSFINQLGVTASATFGVGIKIDDIANKLTLGIQSAAAPMVGQNIGARKLKRVHSVVIWTWILSCLISALFMLIYLTLGQEIFRLFVDDAAVLALAPVFVSAVIWTFPAMSLMRGANALLQGTGNAMVLMVFAFIDSALRVILSYLVGIVLDFGFFGFTLGFALAPCGVAIPGMLYFFFGRWQEKRLIPADRDT